MKCSISLEKVESKNRLWVISLRFVSSLENL
jgi:hypothetical protein